MSPIERKRARPTRWAATVALLSLPFFGFDRACVTQPTTDSLVTTPNVTVKGSIGRYDDGTGNWVENVAGQTRIRRNGGAYYAWHATNADKVWEFAAVPLGVGVNVIDGQTRRAVGGVWHMGSVDDFIVERKTDLGSAGAQQVYLDFTDAAINTKLKAIASGTLSAPLTAAQLNAFAADVKAGITDFFKSAYSGTAVTVVAAPGANVHRVKFHGEDSCSLYGQSPGDYKNTVKGQTSHVYVGTFKCVFVDYGQLIAATPAELSDSVATRVKDVATAIGRTAAHETGHSLGLTADGTLLHGCEGMHNCEAYDDANPSDRFDSGHHIMDPGPKSELYARIGLANATTRTARTPYFERYGKSYLRIIHP